MSNDPRFIISDPQNPGEIGATDPAPATFTHILVSADPVYQEGIKIVVATPSTDPTPKGALYVQAASALDTNPGIQINHAGSGPKLLFASGGTGPDIQFATGVTITETSGQLVFTDTVAGTHSLSALVGGGGGSLTVGAVIVTSAITAGVSLTTGNSDPITDAANGLLPYVDAADFVANFLVYVNGQLMANGLTASSNNDVYPSGVAANGELAFEFNLIVGDIVQVVQHS